MQNINVFEHSEAILKTLSKGAFLTTAAGGRQNTMTIGWGALGFIWGQPVFTVMVRQSRYTRELLEKNPVFTISVPVKEGFAKALGLCGTKSGRDIDKFAAANLQALPAQTVDVPVIQGCGLHLECKVVDKSTMQPQNFAQELTAKWYGDNNWHTYYTGIITAAYLE